MKFRCINNQDVESMLTVGKIYAGYNISDIAVKIYRTDDKQSGWFLPARFEVTEGLVPDEPTTTIWEYTVEGKTK